MEFKFLSVASKFLTSPISLFMPVKSTAYCKEKEPSQSDIKAAD